MFGIELQKFIFFSSLSLDKALLLKYAKDGEGPQLRSRIPTFHAKVSWFNLWH